MSSHRPFFINMILDDFLSVLFPSCCPMCSRPLVSAERVFCIQCISELPKTAYHLGRQNTLAQKFYGRVSLVYALAYLKFYKKGKVQQLLHRLKYNGFEEIGYEIGHRYGKELEVSGISKHFDLILPVPLHPAKLRSRGYNQSDSFAQGLADGMDKPWNHKALYRGIKTTSQTTKSRIARWQNVENIFGVRYPECIQGKHVLVVDDVVTTGATLEACLEEVKKAGASAMSIAAIAEAQ